MTVPARRGVVAGAVAAATRWLIEPADPADPTRPADPARPADPRASQPIVAVVGLSPRCGATTVARGLGAELATRDPAGVCAVTSAAALASVPLGVPAAARLARRLSPLFAGRARACGRLCLVEAPDRPRLVDAVRHLAPLVLDVEEPAEACAAVALADHVLIVGSPATEPALAGVLGESLARIGPHPLAVLNRAGPADERWGGRAHAELPHSRVGAQLALAGREAPGRLGRALASLADGCVVGGRALDGAL